MSKVIAALAAMVMLAFAAGPAAAQTPAAERLGAAIELINARFGPQAEFRAPPPASDPDVAKSLSDISTSIDAMGTDAFPVTDLSTLFSICTPLSQMSVRYVMAGLSDIPAAKGKTLSAPGDFQALLAQPEALELAGRNAVRYQDAITLYMVGTVKCMGLHMPLFTAFWEGLSPEQQTEARTAGVRQMRGGVAQILRGVLMTATDPSISDKNRKALVAGLAGYGGGLTEVMAVADRQALLAEFVAAEPVLKKASPDGYAAITRALGQTACNTLCKIP